ncbi:mitogen-activated protein kinase-binding protein 1-like isoform X2 [Phycodurus eques]|uniref:mitogen-activated protein kinase-binding protein 1-like isoform X2 n=1 Tax=Phycodurus eques TaxID=693459 RepID=UPI002ACEAB76|nr:mitogen-activated protein kinase-binding protein 1-like isoform X2 [Phycodurus eques]
MSNFGDMAERPDCGGSLHAAKRRSAAGSESRHKSSGSRRVKLEKVLGISTASGSALASDPNSGLVAYPAGCVVVLLHPQINKQSHIINMSRKPFSALAFSCDGKHLVTGERGHLPCVRVWQVDDGVEAADVQNHKCGVSCVAFSTGGAYVVSVGDQYDMNVCVWDWRKGSILASNKVSSSVSAISFSEDGSYFVTAGKRHVRFWYLDASKERRGTGTAPLMGRSGLLGDHRQAVFCGVACGRGPAAAATYAVTRSALLCRFDAARQLEAWVRLKASCACSVEVTEDFVFCGCSDGLVRVFSPSDLRYITTLPYPHRLGVELMLPSPSGSRPSRYPDAVALTFNPRARHLTCVYADRSVYVWDVGQLRNANQIHTALYHSAPVWNIQVCPEQSDASRARLPPSSFLTCSSDNTIRLWHADSAAPYNNLYSAVARAQDPLRILHVGDNAPADREDKSEASDDRSAVRVLRLGPDGRRLATGDLCGILRIFDLEFLDELVKIEAHDSEVLALEFSPSSAGVKLLASAGRDRLVRIFNLDRDFRLEQTIADHSAPVVAVKFAGDGAHIRLVSCGADKSVYFYSYVREPHRTAEGGVSFRRTQQAVEKTALHDMDADSSRTHVAVACQDRNVRVYSVETGKLKKCLKDPTSKGGALLKVETVDCTVNSVHRAFRGREAKICQISPRGSDRLLRGHLLLRQEHQHLGLPVRRARRRPVWAFRAGDVLAVQRRLRAPDQRVGRRLCVCVAAGLPHDRRHDDEERGPDEERRRRRRVSGAPPRSHAAFSHGSLCAAARFRRETFVVGPSRGDEERRTPSRPDPEGAPQIRTNGKMPTWFRKLQGEAAVSSYVPSDAEPVPVRNRWLEKSPLVILDYSPSSTEDEDGDGDGADEDEDEDFQPQSLESRLRDEEDAVPKTDAERVDDDDKFATRRRKNLDIWWGSDTDKRRGRKTASRKER